VQRTSRLGDEGFDVGRRTCAGRSTGLAPTGEDRHRRNRADTKPLTELWHGVRVHLDDKEASRRASRYFDELWRHHPAGSAPGRPEIDDDGNRRTRHEPIEIGRRADFYWHCRRRQRLLAASASHGIPEALVLNAIFLSTRRAGYDNPSIVELKISHEAIVSRAFTTCIAHLHHAGPVEVRINGRS
jgi:hypothetical protein